ncbi:MAG: Vacuolar protein sorting-associated protein 29 [Vezdaea aestivalis]|nr:MAG: Vacuolar protein sorting-associated protein 29 [Vezdaea aestivalis]
MAGRLILVLGDLFIPDRAIDIPPKFKKLLTPGKISQILCLGNLTSRATHEFLRTVAPELLLVKGSFDLDTPALPTSRVVQHGKLRIGLTHGHDVVPLADPDALLILARKMDVDVLLSGATGRFDAFELEGKFFINPGSATGAMGDTAGGRENGASFCLMDVQGDVLVLYVYQLKKDEKGAENVGVEKVSFRKGGESGS